MSNFQNRLSNSFKYIFVLTISVLSLLFIINTVNHKPAHAYLAFNNGVWCTNYAGYGFSGFIPSASNVPYAVYDQLNIADCASYSPTVQFYGTVASDWTSTSTSVPYGTSTINLVFNGVATVGSLASSTTITRYTVISSTSGTSGIDGTSLDTNLSGGPNTKGNTSKNQNVFSYSPAGGFVASADYDISLNVKVVNAFNNRGPACVANGANASNMAGSNCPMSGVFMRIHVDVTGIPIRGCTNPAATNYNSSATVDDGSCYFPPPPTISLGVDCVIASGNAYATLRASYSSSTNVTATASGDLSGSYTGSSHTFTGSVIRRSGAYSVTVNLVDSNGNTASSSGTAVCPLPLPPTVTIGSYNCTNLNYTISGEAFTYTSTLNANGASSGFTRSSGPSSQNFTEVARYRDFRTNRFSVTVTNPTFSQSSTSTTVAIGPCVTISCSGATISVDPLEVNRGFNVLPTFSLSMPIGDRGAQENYTVTSVISPAGTVNPPATNTASGVMTPGSATTTISPAIGFTASPVATDFTVTYSLSSTGANIGGCTIAKKSASIPYVQTFLGDVIAGYGMKGLNGDCTPLNSRVRANTGFSLSNSTEIVGSGSQAAVFARGAVTGFRSAITEAGQNGSPWLRTFANSTPTPRSGSQLGGLYAGNLCAENWFDDPPATLVNYTGPIDITPSGVTGYQTSGGTAYIRASGSMGNSRKVYVDGNVYIGDSGLSSFAYSTSWTSVVDIPSTTIIATGNIYIDQKVTNIDAVLVSGGTVFTCVLSGTMPVSANNLATVASPSGYRTGDCNTKPLTINGAIVAQTVRLWRTGGTLSRARTSAGLVINSSGYQPFANGLTGAETIRVSPETYLSPRLGDAPTNGMPGQKQFDSLISLPPIF